MFLSMVIATTATLVFLLLPDVVVRLYSSDPSVIREAALYLWVVGWSQTITAAQSVFEQALAGAGYTFWMSILNTVGNGLRVPLCWMFAIRFDLGSAGAWWAMNATNALKLVAIFLIYTRGRWTQAAAHQPPA
jgi:Na+-driven multidrug efflux pump